MTLVGVLALHSIVRAQDVSFQTPGKVLTGLAEPWGVGIDDATGRIYVAERAAHRISVFERDGTPVRTIGAFGNEEGQLDRPEDVDVSPDGLIVVADTGNHRVQVFDADGTFVRAWGTRGPKPAMIVSPNGVAVADDLVAVSDRDNMNVQVFTFEGEFRQRLRGGLQHDDALRSPRNVCIAEDGRIFAADAGRDTILHFEPSGRTTQIGQWGTYPGLLASPMGVDALGERLIIADTRNDRLQIVERDGTAVSQFNAAPDLTLHRPSDIAVGDGFIVVAEPLAGRCRVFDLTSSPGGMVWTPAHSVPSDAVASDGSLLALHDEGYETVALFALDGDRIIRMTDIGMRGELIGSFNEPGGFVVDGNMIHVADAGNGWIQVFDVEPGSAYDPLSATFRRGIILQARVPQSVIDELGWLVRPDDLARDARGRWLVLDARNRCVFIFGQESEYIDRWTERDVTFDEPIALITHSEHAYVLDAGRREVVVLDLDGLVVDRLPLPLESTPAALAMRDDEVCVASGDRIHRFDADGDTLEPWTVSARLIGLASSGDRLIGVDGATGQLLIIEDGAVSGAITPAPAGRMPEEPEFDPPPAPDEHGWIEMTTADGRFVVRWRASPDPIPLNEPFNIEVRVLDAETGKEPADRVRIGVDATMPHHRHGMIDVVRLRRRGNGTFTGADLRLHMSGSWVFTVDVEREGVIERSSCTVFMP